MLLQILRMGAAVAIGAGLGAMIGKTRSCETGGCPLTANPRRGALYGGLMGLLFVFAFAAPSGPVIEADSGVVEVASTADFNDQVGKSVEPVVVYFHAPWCGACHKFAPIFNELARNYGKKAVFLGVDVQENPELAQEHAVQFLPTSIVFRDGSEVARFVGAFDKVQLLEHLQPQQTASRQPLAAPY